jgi:tRNA (guanine-N7-)-methyltransferase
MSRVKPLPAPIEEIPFVLDLTRMEPPLSLEGLFGRPGPVELELGSGKGLFLISASRLRPESGFIGIERAGKWFHRAVDRILHAGCDNVRLVRADVFDFLGRWIPPASLSALHIYFPDPWPKKRHARRRMLQPALFDLAARAIRPEGVFCLASDVGPYLAEALETIRRSPLFEEVDWPEDAPDRQATNYTRKYLKEGRAIYSAKFRRTAIPAVLGLPEEEPA